MSDTPPSLADRFFRAPDGKIVLAQLPNPPLIAWGVLAVVAGLLGEGTARTGCARLSSAFLLIWAYLEIAQGVNWFRRLLGAVAFIAMTIGFFT